ncbi:hypothetical protein C8Q76DRAFT_789081 [Earliella scabrosa]|nr:hypothetical protein C8Q76DRAFT_789081 [Earliella scabrosa]
MLALRECTRIPSGGPQSPLTDASDEAPIERSGIPDLVGVHATSSRWPPGFTLAHDDTEEELR